MLLLSTSIFAARPILPCEAHPDCASCTADPPCGWCSGGHARPSAGGALVPVRTAHCTEGTPAGPLTHVCDAFHFSACAAPPDGEVARPCEAYTASGCGACVADASCGWCESSQTCSATCDGCKHGYYLTDHCPTGSCGSYATAFTCLRDPRCGYCEDDGTCREGTSVLPATGTCARWHSLAAARPRKGGGDGGIEALARAVAQLSAGRSDRIAAAAAAANRTNATAAPPRAVLPLSVLFDSGGEAKKVGTEQGPVSWFNYHKKPKTCEDVEAKCNEQCNKDNQCTTCCVNCPDNPMEKCFVKPVACTIHSDG